MERESTFGKQSKVPLHDSSAANALSSSQYSKADRSTLATDVDLKYEPPMLNSDSDSMVSLP